MDVMGFAEEYMSSKKFIRKKRIITSIVSFIVINSVFVFMSFIVKDFRLMLLSLYISIAVILNIFKVTYAYYIMVILLLVFSFIGGLLGIWA